MEFIETSYHYFIKFALFENVLMNLWSNKSGMGAIEILFHMLTINHDFNMLLHQSFPNSILGPVSTFPAKYIKNTF